MLNSTKYSNYLYYSPDVGTSRIKDGTPKEIVEQLRKDDEIYFRCMKIHLAYEFHIPGDGDEFEKLYQINLKEWREEHGDELPGKEWQE